jgi:NAD(P)-dependent dehydrogenase (short-subunit alcohol dehydrogenase family)
MDRNPIERPLGSDSGGRKELPLKVDAMIPMGRRGLPEEVARTILFLASDEASLVTSHALVVDAGFTAQ